MPNKCLPYFRSQHEGAQYLKMCWAKDHVGSFHTVLFPLLFYICYFNSSLLNSSFLAHSQERNSITKHCIFFTRGISKQKGWFARKICHCTLSFLNLVEVQFIKIANSSVELVLLTRHVTGWAHKLSSGLLMPWFVVYGRSGGNKGESQRCFCSLSVHSHHSRLATNLF